MKKCKRCNQYFSNNFTQCPLCHEDLKPSSFEKALANIKQESFSQYTDDQSKLIFTDAYKQYNIRSYLRNLSLFLDFDLYKNRLKYGDGPKRFFISPVNITTIINIPWFLFNLINSNIFHLLYTEFCHKCNCKYILTSHSHEECSYNQEYFHILNDINSGKIADTKYIYEINAREKTKQGLKSAHHDLIGHQVKWEAFWDFVSIILSVLFWLYILVNICYPLGQIFLQYLEYFDKDKILYFVVVR